MRLLAMLATLLLAVTSAAQELVTFNNGQVADANDVNANFTLLEERLRDIYTDPQSRENQWQVAGVEVDCTADPYAFQNAYLANLSQDRVAYTLSGSCLVDSYLGVAGRFMTISGTVASDGHSCVEPLPQLITNASIEAAPTVLVVNNLGALVLGCLQLGDNARANGLASAEAYANSLIRMDRVVESPTGNLSVTVRNGSLFRYLGYTAGQGFKGELNSRMGDTELVGSDHAITSLGLYAGSRFNCPNCAGVINNGRLSGGSSVHVQSTLGPLAVAGMSIEPGSNLYTQDSINYGVAVSELDYLDPQDYGRRVYSGGDLQPDPNEPSNACDVASQIAFVDAVTTDWYYWYDELASVDISEFTNANDYLAARMAPVWSDGTGRDPGFSYLTTVAEDTARFTSGTYYGFGFRYKLVNDDFYFSDTFEGSPAYIAGLRRGQQLLAIDLGSGFESWASIQARGASSVEVFGPSDTPISRTFKVNDGGIERDILVTKAEISTAPIAGDPLLFERAGDTPIGYLNFRSFIDSADAPLRSAMEVFAGAGVSDLVIDLRYNGGGLLRVAETLLNLIGGNTANGQLSYIVNFNDKRQAQNFSAEFAPEAETFSPQRIAFITTGGTASASEMLINGMAPHVEIAMVGSDTFGKAVGQSAFDQTSGDCDTRLRLITFETQNGVGQGGFYNGLASTGRFTLLPAADDVTRVFGDPEEASLAVAIDWLNGNTAVLPGSQTKSASSPMTISAFDALWPMNEQPPLNPDGSVRSL